jgi:pimeloyl-ACP methyl ester carboxylesterase
MTDTEIFEPDGRGIPYTDEGNGPAVVLIPDRGLNTAYLGTLAHMLTEADHRILRIGARRPSDATVSMHDLAQDVVDLMDHLQLEHAWIGGHGFGGSVARTVALDHTDRVNGVLLLGVEATADAPRGGDIPDTLRDPDVEPGQRAAQAATPEPEWSGLAPLVPVLVIQGTADPVFPAANGDALQAAAPDRVSVVPVEGGGHLFPVTHAGPTAWAIEDYLDWD